MQCFSNAGLYTIGSVSNINGPLNKFGLFNNEIKAFWLIISKDTN